MKYACLSIVMSFLLVSCQFFETEKISSETFYEEEIKMIDWDDVDHFPTFSSCESLNEKSGQEKCFQKVIANSITEHLVEQHLSTAIVIMDTVKIIINIDQKGTLTIKDIAMDSITQRVLPSLKNIIEKSIYDLPAISPAYKRGIPVSTEFTMPVLINSENL